MRLTILHFNDLHGRLDQLPRLFTLIQRERAAAHAAGRRVLLLDAGDSSERSLWESNITKGRANFALLEAMGVQATVVGNGEALQWGRTALAALVKNAHFPVLAANLVDCADPTQPAVPGLGRSLILDFEGFPLGLIGLTAPYADGYSRFGFCSLEPLPVLRQEVATLKAQGARTLLLLSHLGSDTHFETKDPRFYHDEDAARDVPELDIIIGAHTHDALNPPLQRGATIIAQAGDHGRFLGRLDVDLDPVSGRVLTFSGTLLPCDETVLPDPTIAATLELVREEAQQLFDQRIGRAAVALPCYFDRPSPYANRVADIIRELSHADLAIMFQGFVERDLPAGPLTRRHLHDSLSTSAHLTAATVTGAQIQRMVARMLASPYRDTSYDPARNKPPLGLPAHSANVEINYQLPITNNPDFQILINHQPLDPTQTYRLASTYYTLNAITDDPEYEFIGIMPGQVVENVLVEQVLWEIVADWVKTQTQI